jgi:hypothetical protein
MLCLKPGYVDTILVRLPCCLADILGALQAVPQITTRPYKIGMQIDTPGIVMPHFSY